MEAGTDVRSEFKCGYTAINVHRNNNPDKRGRCPECGAPIARRIKVCAWCYKEFDLGARRMRIKTCSEPCWEARRAQQIAFYRSDPIGDPLAFLAPWENDPFYQREVVDEVKFKP